MVICRGGVVAGASERPMRSARGQRMRYAQGPGAIVASSPLWSPLRKRRSVLACRRHLMSVGVKDTYHARRFGAGEGAAVRCGKPSVLASASAPGPRVRFNADFIIGGGCASGAEVMTRGRSAGTSGEVKVILARPRGKIPYKAKGRTITPGNAAPRMANECRCPNLAKIAATISTQSILRRSARGPRASG